MWAWGRKERISWQEKLNMKRFSKVREKWKLYIDNKYNEKLDWLMYEKNIYWLKQSREW